MTTRTGPAGSEGPSPAVEEDDQTSLPRDAVKLPVIGIGASAGGLEALESFLQNLPAGHGAALVVVQHMDPTSKSMLVELLQRSTAMPVVEVADLTQLAADHVYVIPPTHDLSLAHGVLHLLEPTAPRGQRLPIDFFFCSLAEDLQEHGIGVILSGMGSDGTAGLRAIKEKGGAAFVQDPRTAKFDGMPSSAVQSSQPDVVAPVEELPRRILDYLRHRPIFVRHTSIEHLIPPGDLAKILVLLRARTGHDFAQYKKSTVCRRVDRRMALHQLPDAGNYVRFLRENPQELDLLFSELLIGVTSFFRDPTVWDELRTDILPRLLGTRAQGGQLRAWVAACSTGEEAYSLAMVFREALEAAGEHRSISLQVFATDLDKRAIDKARSGMFPASIAADVGAERLERFFSAEGGGFRVRKEIRDLVIFAPHNAIMDPPFPRLDFLSCRNLLIYLEPELQKKLLRLFHYSLRPGGFLLLGSAETVGSATDLFALEPGPGRVYRRMELSPAAGRLDLPALQALIPHAPARTASKQESAEVPSVEPVNLQSLADHLLLHRYAPASVLVTSAGDIVYIHGKTGRYLEPASGKANWNLFAMAREGLGDPLVEGFRAALAQNSLVTLRDVVIHSDGEPVRVRVRIDPLAEPEGLRGFVMVLFEELPPAVALPEAATETQANAVSPDRALSEQLERAQEELKRLREALLSKSQAMEAARQEARAAHEEFLSMNEELQSTNEELTASKEEMQSMNEELQTLNQELQAKLDELSRTSSDMKNLLNATDIATLFLDDALRVRHFTPETAKIIKLIPSDAGRPISDLSSDLDYPSLVSDARDVLQTLRFCERTVSARDNRWFTVRIMPYATQDNRIEGVVITFADVSVAKRLEADLRANETKLRELLEGQGQQEKGRAP